MSIHPVRFLVSVGVLLLLPVALQGQSQKQGGPWHRVNHQRFSALNLSDAQKGQIKALREKHQTVLKAKVEVAMEARKALHEAMVRPETEVATLKPLYDKVSAAHFELLLERRSLHQEILPLLSAEQRTKLEQRQKEMGHPGGWRRHALDGQPS